MLHILKSYTRLLPILAAWLCAFGLSRMCGLATTDIMTLIFWAFCLGLIGLSHRLNEVNVRTKRAALGLGIFYALCVLAAQTDALTAGFENRLFRLLVLCLSAAGLFLFFRYFTLVLLHFAEVGAFHYSARREEIGDDCKRSGRKLLGWGNGRMAGCVLWAGLMLLWSPWFLLNYPGVMTPDSLSQYAQAMGMIAPSNHHPFAHTLVIGVFLRLGQALFRDAVSAIACYTLFQMTIFAAVLTLCLRRMARQRAPKWLLAVSFLFFGLVPYNGILAVTMWKDILFSSLLLLFVLQLSDWSLSCKLPGEPQDLETAGQQNRPVLRLCITGLTALLLCLFRSNGLYILVFCLPFLLLRFRRQWKPVLITAVVVFAAAFLIKGPVYTAMGVSAPAFTESLSIPAQQIARVVSEGRELHPEERELLAQVVDVDAIPQYYAASISDPIKALIEYGHPEYLEAHKGVFLGLWAKLGLRNPGIYVRAWIEQTRGFWYPEAPWLLTNEGITPNELGLQAQPILRGLKVYKVLEIWQKLYELLPGYGLLYSLGFFTWAAFFLAALTWVRGKIASLHLFVPYLGLLFTLLIATPVNSDLRYIYGLVIAMPLLIHTACGEE